MASASDSASSANSAIGRTVTNTACGTALLTSTMLVSTPSAVALATMPRPASTTPPTTQARQRSRSAGLRIRCSRWSSTRTGGGDAGTGPAGRSGGGLGRGSVTERLCHQLTVACPGRLSRPCRYRGRRRAGHHPRRRPARPHGDDGLEDLVDDVVADAEAGPGHDRAAETAAEERLEQASAAHAALLVLRLLIALLLILPLVTLRLIPLRLVPLRPARLHVVVHHRVDGLEQQRH